MSENHRNPLPTVDIIIELTGGGVVLIARKNLPHGSAGRFCRLWRELEAAVVREAKEETPEVQLIGSLHLLGSKSRPAKAYNIHGIYRHSTGNPARSGRRQESEHFHEGSAPESHCF